MHKPATGKEICSYNARQGASITASITHFLQPQQKYLDLLNWEQISCNPQAELKSIHVFYSINLADLFSCYFFYFTVTFFLLLFFLLLFFLLLFFLLLFFLLPHCYFLSCYFFSCYFFSCYFFSVTFFPVTFFPTIMDAILVRDTHSWDQTHLTHWSLGNLNEILDNELFKLISVINGWGTSGEIATRWLSLDFSDDESTLVQVMAWCRQATSHYLSHCWPRSVSPYDVIRPQWVNLLRPSDAYRRQ